MRFSCRALLGLLAAAAALVALPAVASASITPALTLTQSSGTTAGTSPATVGFNAKFSPSTGDSPKDITLALPSGLLANLDQDGGACLASSSTSAACQIGSGTVSAATGSVPATLYLVKAPASSDVAGVALSTAVGTLTGAVTLQTSPTVVLDLSFTNIPRLGITGLNISLSDLRLPTSCAAANVTLSADSYLSSTMESANAPLTVTGCAGLPYAPKFSAKVTKDSSNTGAKVVLTTTQAANESASKVIEFNIPTTAIGLNLSADTPCVTSGTACTIGTASATSPLVPSAALSNGTVSLGGTITTPTITITFPALGVSLPGVVNLSNDTVTFSNVPDIPLTNLTLTITGPNGSKAFTTTCKAADFVAKFTPQDGNATQTVSSPISYSGCAAAPSSSGTLSGLATGHPGLRLSITHGKGAADLKSVSIRLASGLAFNRHAISSHKVCSTKGKKKKCTTTTRISGLGVSGGAVSAVSLKAGHLVITLKKTAAHLSIRAAAPLLSETTALARKVKKHSVKTLAVTLKITDSTHVVTTTTLKLKA